MKKIFIYILPITLVISLLLACKTVPVTGRKQLNLVPDFMIKEMAFTQYDSVVKASPTLSQYDTRAQMVTRVGSRIQQAVETYMLQNNMSKDLKNFKWEFNTINENIINAWCMPGGKVVVYTGLLPVTQTEEGLAVVMGHEIAHAIARHGNERMSEALLVGLGGIALQEALKDKKESFPRLIYCRFKTGTRITQQPNAGK